MRNAADGKLIERTNARTKTDWNALRAAAWDCLNGVTTLKHYADVSQGSYYNDKVVATHVAAIKNANEVLWKSVPASSDSGDAVFDQLLLAQASAGESRPDFRFSATAHEASMVLLAMTVQWVNTGLGDAQVSIGALRVYDGVLPDSHLCSPKQWRDALCHSEKSKPLQSLFDRMQTQPFVRLRVWIDREWAAVAAPQLAITQHRNNDEGGRDSTKRSPNQKTYKEKVENILIRMRLHATTRGETKRGHYKYLNEKENTPDPEWAMAYKEALAKFEQESTHGQSRSKS